MLLTQIIEEDFTNYKKPAILLAFPICSFKCGKELCHNYSQQVNTVEIDIPVLVQRYLNNPITTSVVCSGLEPFDSFKDLFAFIKELRKYTNDDVVIYTGYTKDELLTSYGYFYAENEIPLTQPEAYYKLRQLPNIIVKYGRYLPNHQKHLDDILGVMLASDNQYAEIISKR